MHQLRAVKGGYVVHRIPIHSAGAIYAVGHRRFAEVRKIQAHQRAAEVVNLLAGQIEHFIFVHMDDLRRIIGGHRAIVAGQVQAAQAVHIGADAAFAARQHRFDVCGGRLRGQIVGLSAYAPAIRAVGQCRNQHRQAQRQRKQPRKSFLLHKSPSVLFRVCFLDAAARAPVPRLERLRLPSFGKIFLLLPACFFEQVCYNNDMEHMFDKGEKCACAPYCTATSTIFMPA